MSLILNTYCFSPRPGSVTLIWPYNYNVLWPTSSVSLSQCSIKGNATNPKSNLAQMLTSYMGIITTDRRVTRFI